MLQIQVSEAMDRDRRKCNLIIMGVAVGDNDDSGKDTGNLVFKELGVEKIVASSTSGGLVKEVQDKRLKG